MIIHAPNIHTGGGRVLLESVLLEVSEPTILIVDSRFQIPTNLPKSVQVIQIQPKIIARLRAEFLLRELSQSDSKVLCFGNLPPLLKLRNQAVLFFQNTILLKKNSNFKFSKLTKIKHWFERNWLSFFLNHVKLVYVQTETVKKDFLFEFPAQDVAVAPFAKAFSPEKKANPSTYQFVYVSSAEPHKNHKNLLKAWELLAEMSCFPSLALTVSTESREVLGQIAEAQRKGAKIQNFSNLSHEEVKELYQKSQALIYPSKTESFGLPLWEAQQMGLDIIASELDYVRELVSPAQTFDPNSHVSISRAVHRYLGPNDTLKPTKVLTPAEFVKLLKTEQTQL